MMETFTGASIVKRFGGKNAAPVKEYDPGIYGPYKRAATGFMGKQWDGGDIAFRVVVCGFGRRLRSSAAILGPKWFTQRRTVS